MQRPELSLRHGRCVNKSDGMVDYISVTQPYRPFQFYIILFTSAIICFGSEDSRADRNKLLMN